MVSQEKPLLLCSHDTSQKLSPVPARSVFQAKSQQGSDEALKTASDSLLDVIQSRSTELRETLRDVTGLEFTFVMSQNMSALLRAAGLYTDNNIPIYMCVDGIQGLLFRACCNTVSSQSRSSFHIWGFEEPENSLEYKKAAALADKIRDTYSKNAQIFLTTDSPAFLAMENAKTTIYRVTKSKQKYERTGHEELVTAINPVFVRGDFRENLLAHDLGLFEVARKFDRENREVEELETKIRLLEQELHLLKKPILIGEGPNDKSTLECAWKRLYVESVPLDILVARGVKPVTPHVKRWALPDEKRMCALCDHDKAGVSAVESLLKNEFTGNVKSPNRSVYKRDLLAMTLPPSQNRWWRGSGKKPKSHAGVLLS